eukprot:398378-Prymnesium_polylepis.4
MIGRRGSRVGGGQRHLYPVSSHNDNGTIGMASRGLRGRAAGKNAARGCSRELCEAKMAIGMEIVHYHAITISMPFSTRRSSGLLTQCVHYVTRTTCFKVRLGPVWSALCGSG